MGEDLEETNRFVPYKEIFSKQQVCITEQTLTWPISLESVRKEDLLKIVRIVKQISMQEQMMLRLLETQHLLMTTAGDLVKIVGTRRKTDLPHLQEDHVIRT